MKDKKIIKKIIIGLLVAIVLLGLYSILVPSQDDTQGGSSSLTSLLNNSVLGQVEETDIALANSEILRVLGSVQDINLNDDIFLDPVFRLLRDSRFSIANPARIGRENPFIPSGFDAIVAAQGQTGVSGVDGIGVGFGNDTELVGGIESGSFDGTESGTFDDSSSESGFFNQPDEESTGTESGSFENEQA